MLGTSDAKNFVKIVSFVIPQPDQKFTVTSDIFLFNFAIDSAALRPQHVKWLNDWFNDIIMERVFHGDIARETGWRALITGEASRSGTAAHNQALSRIRAVAVQNYLNSPLIISRPPSQFEPAGAHGKWPTKIENLEITLDPEGSRWAHTNPEDSADRQVVLRIQNKKDPPTWSHRGVRVKSPNPCHYDHELRGAIA
jgi:hypothetical protein